MQMIVNRATTAKPSFVSFLQIIGSMAEASTLFSPKTYTTSLYLGISSSPSSVGSFAETISTRAITAWDGAYVFRGRFKAGE